MIVLDRIRITRRPIVRCLFEHEHLLLSFSNAPVNTAMRYWFQFRDRLTCNISISRNITLGFNVIYLPMHCVFCFFFFHRQFSAEIDRNSQVYINNYNYFMLRLALLWVIRNLKYEMYVLYIWVTRNFLSKFLRKNESAVYRLTVPGEQNSLGKIRNARDIKEANKYPGKRQFALFETNNRGTEGSGSKVKREWLCFYPTLSLTEYGSYLIQVCRLCPEVEARETEHSMR